MIYINFLSLQPENLVFELNPTKQMIKLLRSHFLHILGLILLFSNIQTWAKNDEQHLDKMLYEREELLLQYDSMKVFRKDTTFFMLKDMAFIQALILQKDSALIESLLHIKNDYNKTEAALKDLKEKNEETSKKLEEKELWLKYGMYAGGVLVLLMLLFIVLFAVSSVKAGKVKKKYKKMGKQLEEQNEILEKSGKNEEALKKAKAEASALNDKMAEKEKMYQEEIVALRKKYDNEMNSLNNRLKDAEDRLLNVSNDTLDNLSNEKMALSNELGELKRQLEAEKQFNLELKTRVDEFKQELDTLKNTPEPVLSEQKSTHDEENEALRLQILEYKKIIEEELQFRKDILNLIENLKKNK
ncbi:MAG: hypothetical protein BWY70_00672 [Bacteroidetes bacterium ADurb.Bin408]|nr:MAG: hypothetical protein BWY70_00672 [Bacteroidetes bacterium ADurb.Bin408]